jgi:hypothetical protein
MLTRRAEGSAVRWWTTKVRQFRHHVSARVTTPERAALATWLRPEELRIFDAMHRADRRHGLDVVASLRGFGVEDRDVLVAGLLHDAGKGRTGVWPRVVWSLGERFGTRMLRAASMLPGMRASLERLRDHADTSARIAHAAGCSPHTVELIRNQSTPRGADGELLRRADEAN